MTIVGQYLQWLEFHIKLHGMAGKQFAFSLQKAGKGSLFSETLAGISTLTQWTPCNCSKKSANPDYLVFFKREKK